MIVVAALVAAASLPAAAAAADDTTQVLPDITVTALTTDLDGDGDREVVRLVQDEGNTIDFTVDAWEHDGSGWAMVGSAALPRAADDGDGFVESGQAATLLLWQHAGRERVLAFAASLAPGAQTGETCCLTVFEVRSSRGGGIELSVLHQADGGVQSAWSADVDGDGSDELVLHEAQYGLTEDEQIAILQVLRWTGTAFELAFERTDRELIHGFVVADTDGVTGKDLLLGPATDGSIRRLAWDGGEMVLEAAQIDADQAFQGWIAGVAADSIVLSMGEETRVVRWPRGEAATTAASLDTPGLPGIGFVGSGPDALVVLQGNLAFETGESPTVTVHDLDLALLGEVESSPRTEVFWQLVSGQMSSSWALQRNLYPYSGPINGGLGDDRPAYVSSGMLIQPGGPDGFEARPMASLIGVQPVGLAGPHDAWLVLGGNYSPPPGAAYMSWGGVPTEWGRLAITPVAQLLQPDDAANVVSVQLRGAVEVASDGELPTLMADGEGFKLAVTAPAGSVVVVVNGALADDHEVTDEPLVVDLQPPRNRQDDENVDFEAMLLVVTPDGRGVTEQWDGTFVRELPEISVSGSTDAMALSATLSGRASPGSAVTAEGVAIETDSEGRFSASIDAPIWPSRVLLTARDPLGNEATEVVEVVGLVDYRGLPWAAILVVATLVVGGVLYVRTPKRRAAAATLDGDGRLEELALDAVDGSEPGRR
ncbi:MAG TPA: hypothetical protein VEW95_06705 [Candidatus Limnocylindrales bacterium]|nr:hypothetical protein [Candidatus Limnocylindrales bacterium]